MKKIKSKQFFNHALAQYCLWWLVVALLQLLNFWQLPQNLLAKLIQPMQTASVELFVGFNQAWQQAKYLKNSARRVQDLERQLAFAQASLAEQTTLREENQILRDKLKTFDSRNQQIISFAISSFTRPAIAVGSAQGVQLNDPVLINNTLIGVVDQVASNYAFIKLLKDFTDRAVLVKTAGGVEAILRGDGRRIVLEEINMSAQLDLKDQVMTLGQPGIPRGLAVGYVSEINKQPTDLAQRALLDQLVDFYQSSLVEVMVLDNEVEE